MRKGLHGLYVLIGLLMRIYMPNYQGQKRWLLLRNTKRYRTKKERETRQVRKNKMAQVPLDHWWFIDDILINASEKNATIFRVKFCLLELEGNGYILIQNIIGFVTENIPFLKEGHQINLFQRS